MLDDSLPSSVEVLVVSLHLWATYVTKDMEGGNLIYLESTFFQVFEVVSFVSDFCIVN